MTAKETWSRPFVYEFRLSAWFFRAAPLSCHGVEIAFIVDHLSHVHDLHFPAPDAVGRALTQPETEKAALVVESLYSDLGILDSKTASLGTLTAILLIPASYGLSQVPLPWSQGGTWLQPFILAGLFLSIAVICLMLVIWVHWSEPRRESFASLRSTLVQLVEIRAWRTRCYRAAWILTLPSVPLMFWGFLAMVPAAAQPAGAGSATGKAAASAGAAASAAGSAAAASAGTAGSGIGLSLLELR